MGLKKGKLHILHIHVWSSIFSWVYNILVFLFRGDSTVVQCGEVVGTLWQDNKVVRMLSTNCQPQESGTVTRKLRDGTSVNVTCPAPVIAYNKFMGGVDQNDQLRQYYHVRLRGRKYYKYIFWFVLDVSISNSYILFFNYTSDNSPRRLKCLKKFRLQLAKELIADYCSRNRLGVDHLRDVTSSSSLSYENKTATNRASRCFYCSHIREPSRRRETVWYCGDCKLHLCHTGVDDGSDCFLLHHRQQPNA